jgi:2-methylcitrate dehydratase PrpD
MTAAQDLGSFTASLSGRTIPRDVRRAVTRHVLDAVGVALAASAASAGTPVVDAVRAWGGTRESSIIGSDATVPAQAAGLANGVLVHALDFDDTHVSSLVHPSSVVVPAALAVAEETGCTGAETVTACVIGYEVAARIGAAMSERVLARGLYPTGFVGPFASAAVAARLWGLDGTEIAHALGIAGSQSSGLFASVADGSETKRFLPGWAAHAGIVAADLARRGMTGPGDGFERRGGFFGAYLDGETGDAARVARGLGYEWETLRIAIKPYPASHFVHAFMDAARGLGVHAADVDEVVCFVPEQALAAVAEPRRAKIAPATPYAARFSLPFSVAVVMTGGRDALDLFDEDARTDRRVLSLAERVRAVADPALPFPETYGGRMTVLLRDGRERHVTELVNRGHPDRPLSDDEVRTKFFSNARRRLDEAAAEKLADAIAHLDELDSMREITALFQSV